MTSLRSDKATGKVMVFWDYDAQWGVDNSRLQGGASWSGEQEFVNTDVLLDLHGDYAIPACFAVVGAIALKGERPYHNPRQVRRIQAEGHEVASHSMYHEWLPALTLDELRSTLARSKDSLEQCLGEKVTSFVPPFNRPFDFPKRTSISLSERKSGRKNGTRIGIETMCRTLCELEYTFSRVSYRTIPQRISERFFKKKVGRPAIPEQIAGLTCVRLNTRSGFTKATRCAVLRASREGGIAVVYGHPHSISEKGNRQHVGHLKRMLDLVARLRREGSIEVVLPRKVAALAA